MALSAALPSTVSALAAFALTHASIASSATESFVSLIIGGPSSAVQNLTASVPYTARPIGENVDTSALLSRKARGVTNTSKGRCGGYCNTRAVVHGWSPPRTHH